MVGTAHPAELNGRGEERQEDGDERDNRQQLAQGELAIHGEKSPTSPPSSRVASRKTEEGEKVPKMSAARIACGCRAKLPAEAKSNAAG